MNVKVYYKKRIIHGMAKCVYIVSIKFSIVFAGELHSNFSLGDVWLGLDDRRLECSVQYVQLQCVLWA